MKVRNVINYSRATVIENAKHLRFQYTWKDKFSLNNTLKLISYLIENIMHQNDKRPIC